MRSRARDVVDSNWDWGEGNVQTATISLLQLRSKMLDDARMMLSNFFSLWGMETNRHRSGGGVLAVRLDFLEFWICRKHCYVI